VSALDQLFHDERPDQLRASDVDLTGSALRRFSGGRVRPAYRGVAHKQLDANRFVLHALEQALFARRPDRDGSLVCHSDRRSPYGSIRYTERLADSGIEPSAGSEGDADNSAQAKAIN
jgi:putative transposase